MLRNARAATVAALIGSLALASAAEAKTPKSATYKLNLAITQHSDWKYVKQQRPSCDWPETGEGEQQIDVFAFDEPARVRVTGKKVRVLKPKPMENAAHGVVISEWDRKFSKITPCPGGGDYGGGDTPNRDVAGKDECLASGQVHLWVGKLARPGVPVHG